MAGVLSPRFLEGLTNGKKLDRIQMSILRQLFSGWKQEEIWYSSKALSPVDMIPVNLRFLISCCRKNSVRDKVIGKKWVYLQRNTLHRVWAISEDESLKIWQGYFLWAG